MSVIIDNRNGWQSTDNCAAGTRYLYRVSDLVYAQNNSYFSYLYNAGSGYYWIRTLLDYNSMSSVSSGNQSNTIVQICEWGDNTKYQVYQYLPSNNTLYYLFKASTPIATGGFSPAIFPAYFYSYNTSSNSPSSINDNNFDLTSSVPVGGGLSQSDLYDVLEPHYRISTLFLSILILASAVCCVVVPFVKHYKRSKF